MLSSHCSHLKWIGLQQKLYLVVLNQQIVNLSLLIKNMYVFVSLKFSQFPSAKLIEINSIIVNLTRMLRNIDTLYRFRVYFSEYY